MDRSTPTGCNNNWFYVGQDERIYGPSSSREMLGWANAGFFDGDLLLRTENDDRFYTLIEWIQACGNKSPFLFSITSWDAVNTDKTNQENLRLCNLDAGGPPAGLPLNTAWDASNHLQFSSMMQQNQIRPASQMLPQLDERIKSSNTNVSAPLMVMNGPRIPVTNALYSPAHPPPFIYPVVSSIGGQPLTTFISQNSIFQRTGNTTGVPYLRMIPRIPAFSQFDNNRASPFQANSASTFAADSEFRSSTASDSPESEQNPSQLTQRKSLIDKIVDTVDANWNNKKFVDCGIDPIPSPLLLEQKSVGTQTPNIQVSTARAEKLFNELLGLHITIVESTDNFLSDTNPSDLTPSNNA